MTTLLHATVDCPSAVEIGSGDSAHWSATRECVVDGIMFEAKHIVVRDSVLLYASAATCALLNATTQAQLAQALGDLVDDDVLAAAGSNGSHEISREFPTFRLRLKLNSLPRAELTPLRFVGVVEPELTNEAPSERQLEIDHAYAKLRTVEAQLLQSDKMASIGQLAAGVAHEINNPIGYIHSNLGTLGEYITNLLRLIAAYEEALHRAYPDNNEQHHQIDAVKQQVDYEFLVKDLPMLLSESREGIERVRKIVQDLRDFSRAGYTEEWTVTDLHRGLDSTLNIVWNDLKYKCDVQRQFGDIPQVECLPSQLNQVFLNILVNAGHAIEGKGTIKIATGRDGANVFIEISDTGRGIPEENVARIFDPFFTTKPVGQGTGLGLSLSYSIVRKHAGRIEVSSKVGSGTTFRIILPVRQEHTDKHEAATASTPR
jgi:two-component system, NtrC family, sensor kinase